MSNIHRLWVLVLFDYSGSLIEEFKSVVPKPNKCPLHLSLSRTVQASNIASANRGILSTIVFLITRQEKSGFLILYLAPATKEMPCIVLTGRYIKSPHTLGCAMGKIHWEHLDSEYQGKPFSLFSRETKKSK